MMKRVSYCIFMSLLFSGMTKAAIPSDIDAQLIYVSSQTDSDLSNGIVMNFNQAEDRERWRITNDGVMGGLSQGQIAHTDEYLTFSGDISTENNGGFSSVYRPIPTLTPEISEAVINVEGDGQTYQLRLVANINGYRVPYKQSFSTVKGQRQQITLSFKDFQASFRGRIISSAPTLAPSMIKELGFLMTKKSPGDFALHVYSVKFL